MRNTKEKLTASQIVFLLLTIAIMITIFILSAEDAERSSKTSSTLTKTAVKLIDKDYAKRPPAKQHEIWSTASFIVRKLAHFSIYTALGFCASMTAGKRNLLSLKSLFVVIFGFAYAFSDELHQTFSEGRSCEFRDMMIDTCGSFIGMVMSIIFMCLTAYLIRRRHKKTFTAVT